MGQSLMKRYIDTCCERWDSQKLSGEPICEATNEDVLYKPEYDYIQEERRHRAIEDTFTHLAHIKLSKGS